MAAILPSLLEVSYCTNFVKRELTFPIYDFEVSKIDLEVFKIDWHL